MKITVWLLAAVLAAGCTDTPAAETSPPAAHGAASARGAVDALLAALVSGDFAGAADLTLSGQAVAVAASEGIGVDELVIVIETDDQATVATFWRSFADNLVDLADIPAADLSATGDPTTFEAGGASFARVRIDLLEGRSGVGPTIVVREHDGWWIDLVATFPAVMATRIPDILEAARESVDGAVITAALAALRPGLEAALEEPGLPSSTGSIIREAIVAFET